MGFPNLSKAKDIRLDFRLRFSYANHALFSGEGQEGRQKKILQRSMRRTVKGSAQRFLSRRHPFDRRRFGRPEGQGYKGKRVRPISVRAILSSEHRVIQRGWIKPCYMALDDGFNSLYRRMFRSERFLKTRS